MPGGAGAQLAQERRTWWLLWALLTLAGLAWAASLPLMTGPDEPAHAVRAAGIVRGELVGRPIPGAHNHFVTVPAPAGYDKADDAGLCFVGDPHYPIYGAGLPRTADCPVVAASDREADVLTYEHRGQPTFYALVGGPSLWLTGQDGLYLMRAIGVFVGAALLASAMVTLRRLPNPRLAAIALFVALTPTALYMIATVNTAGLEIAAAFCAWTGCLALALGVHLPDRRLVARAGVGLTVLTLTRGVGPGFAVVVLLVCAALAPAARRRMLFARHDVRAWLAVVTVAFAASAAWLAYVHRSFPLPNRTGAGLGAAVGEIPWWLRSIVGVMGSDDVAPPVALHVAWGLAVIAVLAWALVAGRPARALVGLGLLAMAVVLLVSGEGFSVPQTGYRWQGRYVFPLVVGGLMVAASVKARAAPPADDRRWQRLAGMTVTLLVAIQVFVFTYALRHYTVGFDGTTNPLSFLTDPIWSPPTGPPWLWLMLFTASWAGAAVVVLRMASPASSWPAAAAPRPLLTASSVAGTTAVTPGDSRVAGRSRLRTEARSRAPE
jgi:hypothetical protein